MKKFTILLLVPMLLLSLSQTIFADTNLSELHQEIDAYVFEENKGEFPDLGVSVTHTGPMEDVVEIGITPYSEESAKHFYDKFGNDNISVVEGQLATTLAATTTAAPENVPAEETTNTTAMYVLAAAVLLIGMFVLLRFRKKA